MDKLVDRILVQLQNANLIDTGETDIYRFGVECMLLKVIHYTSYLCIGFAMRMLIPLLVSTIVIMPLRKRAGGYHAKTRIGCYIFSCAVVAVVCILNKLHMYLWLSISILCISNLIIGVECPVENENRTLDSEEKAKFRKQALLLMGLADVIIIAAMAIGSIVSQWLVNGMLVVAFVTVLGKLNNESRIKEDRHLNMRNNGIR